jgi:hypothetical protein
MLLIAPFFSILIDGCGNRKPPLNSELFQLYFDAGLSKVALQHSVPYFQFELKSKIMLYSLEM